MAKSKAAVQVVFVAKENGPERLVSEAEIHFEEGPLAGMRLVGFSLWRSAEGELYVTFPSRAFGIATERRLWADLRYGEMRRGRPKRGLVSAGSFT